MADERDMIEIENVNVPGKTYRVERQKFEAMREALLSVLPAGKPGLSSAEIKQLLIPKLPQDLFPGGAKAGWWLKSVQLDLEAKRIIRRVVSKPLRFYKIKS